MLSSSLSLKTRCCAPYTSNCVFLWIVLPITGPSAPISHLPWEHAWLWNAPFLNRSHSDSNLEFLSITSTHPIFCLRPLEPSAHFFNYSLSDNSVPSVCHQRYSPDLQRHHPAQTSPLASASLLCASSLYLLFPAHPSPQPRATAPTPSLAC